MLHRLLGPTGVKVSSLCLGTMNFGEPGRGHQGDWTIGIDDARPIFAAAVERGLFTFDCADVYGLGATLYWFLTGRSPYEGAYTDIISGVAERDPVPPHRIDRAIPVDLETIVLKCLEKEPANRYSSAAALADDLERWLSGKPIDARPVGGVERAWRWCRRNPALAAVPAAAASRWTWRPWPTPRTSPAVTGPSRGSCSTAAAT